LIDDLRAALVQAGAVGVTKDGLKRLNGEVAVEEVVVQA